jgi:2-oxoisovalerate dehydrogenase E2 component (dihydrolipoyl transacylase)
MLAEIIMPKMGDASGDCCVEEWKKSIGEPIAMGEVICVVATEKATFDIESPYEGILAQILVQPNVTVPPGTPIGRVEVSEVAVT